MLCYSLPHRKSFIEDDKLVLNVKHFYNFSTNSFLCNTTIFPIQCRLFLFILERYDDGKFDFSTILRVPLERFLKTVDFPVLKYSQLGGFFAHKIIENTSVYAILFLQLKNSLEIDCSSHFLTPVLRAHESFFIFLFLRIKHFLR